MISQQPVSAGGQPRSGGGGGSSSGGGSSTTTTGTLVRKNQAALSAREWDTLLCAMEALKKDKGSRNWDYFADLHKKYGAHDEDTHDLPHLDGQDLMIHSPFYWLPWHRKFIREFEERLQDFEPGVTLPYWNWVTSREIPEELEKQVFGWMHVTRAVFHNGDKLPTSAQFAKVTGATTYASFDSQLNVLHGLVHGWVGGEMGNIKKSANDPLFFLHHAFIDKTWSDWALAHPTQAFPTDYLSFTLPPWSTKVSEVLTIDDLNYEYR
jgi:tyrosinase